ncbi:MAG: hypothetical protein FWF75_04500 [Propionibacteriaceae bacterium]|nr:hypothetical protein [Propionibacteriaceae bacterium]
MTDQFTPEQEAYFDSLADDFETDRSVDEITSHLIDPATAAGVLPSVIVPLEIDRAQLRAIDEVAQARGTTRTQTIQELFDQALLAA